MRILIYFHTSPLLRLNLGILHNVSYLPHFLFNKINSLVFHGKYNKIPSIFCKVIGKKYILCFVEMLLRRVFSFLKDYIDNIFHVGRYIAIYANLNPELTSVGICSFYLMNGWKILILAPSSERMNRTVRVLYYKVKINPKN